MFEPSGRALSQCCILERRPDCGVEDELEEGICLLSTCYVLGTALGIRDPQKSTKQSPSPHEAYIPVGTWTVIQ